MPPESKVDIRALSTEFSVSAIPIREALRQLEEKGLIDSQPSRGFYVISLSQRDVHHIFQFRKLLESYAIDTAGTRIPKGQIKELSRRTRGLLSGHLGPEKLRLRFDAVDIQLHHDLIVGSCGNTYVEAAYERMLGFTNIVRHLNQAIESSIRQHLEILEALLRNDIHEARTRLNIHLDMAEAACSRVPETWLGSDGA